MRYLLTPSLYSAWRWSHEADDEHWEHARQDLITILKREEIPPNEFMLKGRKLEADVQAVADGQPQLPLNDPRYENVVNDIAEIVKGGLWQDRIYHDLYFRDHGGFLLYGKMDVGKAPFGFDIKYAKSYEWGKYYKSIQHTAYMSGANLPKFAYLISDGREWWREDYTASEEGYQNMRSRLVEMLDDIRRDPELSALYTAHWKADRDKRKRKE